MQDFIRDENIKLYRRALADSTDEEQRKVLMVLLQLLVAEQAALAPRPKQIAPENFSEPLSRHNRNDFPKVR